MPKIGWHEGIQFIDDREVKKYLWMRYSPIAGASQVVEVHAFDKDHALVRLTIHYIGTKAQEWELVDELPQGHFVGALGTTLELSKERLISEQNSMH